MPKKRAPNIKALERPRSDTGLDVTNIVAVVFLFVALVLCIVAALLTTRTLRKMAIEVSAPGVVVEMVERVGPSLNDNGSYNTTQQVTYFYPLVEFYTPEETLHRVQIARGSWPPEYEVGQEVIIWYDPQHPLDAHIQSDSETLDRWFAPVLLGLMGLIFLIVALAILWASRRNGGKLD